MKNKLVVIQEGNSGRVSFSHLIISLRYVTPQECVAAFGYPGLPNVLEKLCNGDAVLYETPTEGVLEARVFSLSNHSVEFLVTQVSPRPGLLAGATSADPNNSPFNEQELVRIQQSIVLIKDQLQCSSSFVPEQFGLISRKLDEIQEASRRMGRKDWINYVAGSLTTVCASAAFAPEVTKGLFRIINNAFTWLFANAWSLIS